ncbi:MAG: (2Fe-2S)-binding protein [Planctomycetaceae bacterium]|nr:(2Fe-2S)-binding protein [Planctomycetaceae bacterium]
MNPDDELCYCFHVTKRKVINFIRVHQPRVPSQISECGGAGTGCGWCVPFLRRCFEAENGRPADAGELTPEDYAAQRAEYLVRKKSGPQ